MNKAAIFHTPNLGGLDALSDREVIIRIRSGRGDLEGVTLVHIDKYRTFFHDEHVVEETPMEVVARDDRYDHYEALISHDVQVTDYYFRIQHREGGVCYGNGAFFDEVDLHGGSYFSMPRIQPADLFELPDWTRDAVVYQIFPDSFYRGDGESFEGWSRCKRDEKDHLGGTLRGVIDKLDYIQSLGANVVYMTPIIESPTNHKYHTADYYRIDPRLGTEDDFRELVSRAHNRGMRVVLDGVLHATGLDFPAFKDVIQNGPASTYWDWYLVDDHPVRTDYPINYRAWADLREMPSLNLANPDVAEYLLDVMTHWVREYDIDGWRLDTVDALPYTFLREARRRIRAIKQDCVIVGELWYDARPWLQGDTLDSVMNYKFTTSVLSFIGRRQIKPSQFSNQLGWIRGRYRLGAWEGLWNLLSSHDIRRFLTEANHDREALKMAVLLQFTYPGVPFVYAGDELGMMGHSLICRCGLVWNQDCRDLDLLEHYRTAGRLYREHAALRRGDFQEVIVDDDRGLYGYWRRYENDEVLAVFNVSDKAQSIEVEPGFKDLMTGEATETPRLVVPALSAVVAGRPGTPDTEAS